MHCDYRRLAVQHGHHLENALHSREHEVMRAQGGERNVNAPPLHLVLSENALHSQNGVHASGQPLSMGSGSKCELLEQRYLLQ